MYDSRISDNNEARRDVPSFIEPRPPLISNPFMRPKPEKGTNLLDLFEDDSECEEPELVQVYLRLKPCKIPSNLYEVRSDRCLITSLDTATAGHGRRTQHNVSKMYTFSHIFGPESSQKEIFENVVKENLRKLVEGHSFTLLTYGASGSGKTYTLMGTVVSPGLVPRSLEYVFRLVDVAQQPLYKPSERGADELNYAEQDYELQWVKRLRQVSAPLREKYRRMSARLCSDMTASTIDLSNTTKYYIWVSFVEIYNEAIYDLLAPGERRNATKLLIREDSNGTVYVKGATQAFVRTGEEAYDVMVAGKHNLQVAATGVHAQSSRSHCIFTITMLTHTDEGVRVSCVRLCDLAGCERQRRARNHGARMLESRAINSSLHVLERCLHTLRRKQRNTRNALVPYRESKLTRLLGAGLSGAKGEGVSMVVTLNPSPEYAHETKHVLQLAAVARDIQINHTMSDYPSTLESSQDTTLSCSSEVLKLRVENERLHFELVQAESRNKELKAAMEERQATNADNMREVAEEAKDIMREYYEAQLQALRDEMDEMVEDYESKLNKAAAAPPVAETPSKSLQNKVTQLMTEIAILEEKLTAEKLARARAEEEVQHLRACIEERDEKSIEEDEAAKEDVVSLTDSDDSETEDPCNESLEPTFTKEDINRSRLLRQSLLADQQSSQDTSMDSGEKSEVSVLEKSADTVKDADKEDSGSFNETYATGNESELKKSNDVSVCDIKRLTLTGEDSGKEQERDNRNSENKSYFEEDRENDSGLLNDDNINCKKKSYFVEEMEPKAEVLINPSNLKSICRGTYFISDSKIENSSEEVEHSTDLKTEIKSRDTIDLKNSDSLYETMQDSKSLSLESNDNNDSNKSGDSQEISEKPEVMVTKDVEKVDVQWEIPRKASVTLVNKIKNALKTSTNSNSSLAQFEQLEKAAKDGETDGDEEIQEMFSNIKIKGTRNYFDDASEDIVKENEKLLERKTYFGDMNANVNKVADKRLTEIVNKVKHDEFRSPSIVKEEITSDFEPSTIKRLLGESMTRQPEPVNKFLIKKQESLDIFDSPQVPNIVTTQLKKIETVTETIEKIEVDNIEKRASDIPIPVIKISRSTLDNEIITGDYNVKQKSISLNKSPTKGAATIKSPLQKPVTANIDKIFKIDNALGELEINSIKKSLKKDVLKSPKQEKIILNHTDQSCNNDNTDNTVEEFENIYKDISVPRAAEFELLVTQEETHTQDETNQEITKTEVKYNLRHRSHTDTEKKHANDAKKSKINEKKNLEEDVILENVSKSESTTIKKKKLRLRRRKNATDDESKEEDKDEQKDKLKDIINLQSEFSDVTMDTPAPVKEMKDIPSPEKIESEGENMPPAMGIQSCPSKSVTRSRRKLFTPRAEPLDESVNDESGGRVCVPRPSYHRPRARRKL